MAAGGRHGAKGLRRARTVDAVRRHAGRRHAGRNGGAAAQYHRAAHCAFRLTLLSFLGQIFTGLAIDLALGQNISGGLF